MRKDRPLTERQKQALLQAEPTLFGDTKIVPGFGGCLAGLRSRGLVTGLKPHVYLTDAGKQQAAALTA